MILLTQDPFTTAMPRFIPEGPFRVRFAPSPTGFLHLGGLRTALFNYLIARKFPKSQFILRVEDTDQSRSVPGAAEQLISTLKWTGLDFDEGPGKDSQLGPFVQSMRLDMYKDYVNVLLEKGAAYRCYCSKERLEAIRSATPYGKYDQYCRRMGVHESKMRFDRGEHFTIRLKAPADTTIVQEDLVYGRILTESSELDDTILVKSDGFPTYHFANVVDDHLMNINLVIRGQEWIASTPLHLLLYRAFNWKQPWFAHLPLLVNPNGTKLSKRQNDAHVAHYIERGYLPEALLNFVAYLGWAPSRELKSEVLSLDELVRVFSLAELNMADATVNIDKLNWLNGQHVKRRLREDCNVGDLVAAARDEVKTITDCAFEDKYIADVLSIMAERIAFPRDLVTLSPYFFSDPVHKSPEATVMWEKIQAKYNIASLSSFLNQFQDDPISAMDGSKNMGMLSRLILTAQPIGPPIRDTAAILGPEACRQRAKSFRRAFHL